ncbi:M20 family metallopeptidase [Mesorhizobium sp. INR15]|uniref:M20 family metallopeptidase n=1 Tax=Mesorhizobium sp. INR15 TaxID=2654248 RepID=UPI0018966D68|nr:M20/M25/M40 family metallo-hydrolase [Mesorhizobium sp. INR15]QPC95477.1 M20/M25/M40 family metallo-hydrolase [Mesorhizobium sp. INR15]
MPASLRFQRWIAAFSKHSNLREVQIVPRPNVDIPASFPNPDKIIAIVSSLCAHSSVSGTEGKIGDWVASEMARIGLAVTRQEVLPGRANIIGTLETGRLGPTLLFNGHIDTLPVPEGYSHPPFEPFVANGRLYGAEINNMKGAVGAMIAAMEILHDRRDRLCGRIILSAVMAECDTLGLGTLHLIESGLSADLAINGEPTDLRVMTCHVGVTQIRMKASGVSVHVCRKAEGPNAIHALIPALAAIGEHCLSYVPHQDFPDLPNLNIGQVSGGTLASMHADRAEALVDVRTVPGMTPESVLADIRAAVEKAGAATTNGSSVTAELIARPDFCQQHPFHVERGEPVVRAVAEAHRELAGAEPYIGPLYPQVYFGTDASHLGRAGIPTVIYGPGKVEEINVADESMALLDLMTAAQVYARAAAKICGRQ